MPLDYQISYKNKTYAFTSPLNSILLSNGEVKEHLTNGVKELNCKNHQLKNDLIIGDKIISSSNKILTDNIIIKIGTTRIYGVSWDGSSRSALTRTDDSIYFSNPIPYHNGMTAAHCYSPFDNIAPWSELKIINDSQVGSLVSIPKFYYSLTQNENNNGLTVKISSKPVEGFSVSPAHADRGDGKGERDMVYIGRYHCASLNLKSVNNQLPKVLTTRSAFRTSIHSLGNTIWQADFAIRFTIWLLYIVEFANWDSQRVIGYGCGDGRNLTQNGYTDLMPYHTGTMTSSINSYGFGTQYRNIEGLWDNALDFMDGCYNNSNGLNIILNPANFSDNSNGVLLGKTISGFPTKFNINSNVNNLPLFYPVAVGGSNSTYICDQQSYNSALPCLAAGAFYFQSLDRGLLGITSVRSNASDASISSRLMKLP